MKIKQRYPSKQVKTFQTFAIAKPTPLKMSDRYLFR